MSKWKALVIFWCSCLAAADLDQLRQLAAKDRFFELRRALDEPGAAADGTLLYRGLIASHFGHENEGIEMLRRALAENPPSEMTLKAWEAIAGAYERLGRYKDAAQAWTEALKLTPRSDPDRDGNENTRDLLEALADVPPQTVEFGADISVDASRNKLDSWNVPVEVNGVAGSWIFDTGANVSTVTESEAKRMGLTLRETKGYVTGSTAKKNPLRLAVANELRFGSARLRNVILLVLADNALHIGPLHEQINGILGLPVLRALGRVAVSKTGAVQIHHTAAAPATREPNLFFEEETPIVEIARDQNHLQMFLDTGSNATFLYPSFRGALGAARLRTHREKMAGAGGMIKRKDEVVPALRIDLLGKPIDLKNISLLPDQPHGVAGLRDGVIGMDALWNGFLLDFDAMRLEAQ